MENITRQELYKLIQHIKHTVNMPTFIESLTDVTIKKQRSEHKAVCNCPMPWHNDKNASFHMNLMPDGTWVYHCFGCHYKGNIISFYMSYTGVDDLEQAIKEICKKLNITSLDGIDIQTYQNVINRSDKKREMENQNIIISNLCRLLLKRNFKKNYAWVENQYSQLNYALDNDNQELLKKIEQDVVNKMEES